jgi:hypothetical protein
MPCVKKKIISQVDIKKQTKSTQKSFTIKRLILAYLCRRGQGSIGFKFSSADTRG